MPVKRLFLAAVCLAILVSLTKPTYAIFDDLFGVKAATEATAREIRAVREMAEKVAKAAIRAVPGERYLQLIDDLHGIDEERKHEARLFLARLGNIDPSDKWEVSIGFKSLATGLGSLDMFRGSIPARELVQEYVAGYRLSWRPIDSALSLPPDADAVRNKVYNDAKSFLEAVRGKPVHSTVGIFGNDLTWSKGLSGAGNEIAPFVKRRLQDQQQDHKGQTKLMKEADARLTDIADRLTDAIMSSYTHDVVRSNIQRLTEPWNVLDGDQYLFVLISKGMYESHFEGRPAGSAFITAAVHKADDPERRFNDRPSYSFTAEDFNPTLHAPVYSPLRPSEPIFWAVHEMTNTTNISANSLQALRDVKQLLKTWDVENTEVYVSGE